MTWAWAIALLSIIVAVGFGYFCHYYVSFVKAESAVKTAEIIVQNAKTEADVLKREAEIEARNKMLLVRESAEADIETIKQQLGEKENRLAQRETKIDQKIELLDQRETNLESKIEEAKSRLSAAEYTATNIHQQLSNVAGLSKEEAKAALLDELRDDLEAESAELIRKAEADNKAKAESNARGIIGTAIQRYAAAQANIASTSSVPLPNDEMKGRIIGKEGRNIRSFMEITGVDLLIDDTPGLVVLSGFDPMRRELARLCLENLIEDGRIHPTTIEESYRKVQTEVTQTIRQAGEDALYQLGLRGVADEVTHLVGKLKFRTSYSQNVLQHSIEMGFIMANMAGELGLDADIAKRIGLFHDIGKAMNHEHEGGHAEIGAALLEKHNEDPIVVNAVAAHHGDMEQKSIYAALCVAADAITASRPGARLENTEIYIKRLKDLEEIANAQPGVLSSYAIQAGRELRVLVQPSEVNDDQALLLARAIANEIEQKMKVPSAVQVTVVRETRCVEYAKA